MSTCTKRGFWCKREAKQMLRSAQERGKHYRAECRVYRCDKCGTWHLTSMTLEDYEASLVSGNLSHPN